MTYLAGIVDGEGWIVWDRGKYLVIGVSMADEDVIRTLSILTGTAYQSYPYTSRVRKDGGQLKTRYMIRWFGGKARCLATALAPYLGERKRATALSRPPRP